MRACNLGEFFDMRRHHASGRSFLAHFTATSSKVFTVIVVGSFDKVLGLFRSRAKDI